MRPSTQDLVEVDFSHWVIDERSETVVFKRRDRLGAMQVAWLELADPKAEWQKAFTLRDWVKLWNEIARYGGPPAPATWVNGKRVLLGDAAKLVDATKGMGNPAAAPGGYEFPTFVAKPDEWPGVYEHPVFGKLISVGNGEAVEATFEKSGLISFQLAKETIIALQQAGAMTSNPETIAQALELKGLVSETKIPKHTSADAMQLILREIEKSPDPLRAAGEWLTKMTNEITRIARESEKGPGE